MTENYVNNEHLINAAPDMLAALEAARKVIDELLPGIGGIACDIGLINSGAMQVTEAINKAKGKKL